MAEEQAPPFVEDGARSVVETDRFNSLEDLPEGRRCTRCSNLAGRSVMVFTEKGGCPTCGAALPKNKKALTHGGASKQALQDRAVRHEQRLRTAYGLPIDALEPHPADGLVKVMALYYARLEQAGSYSLSSPESLTSDRQMATDRVLKNAADVIRDYTRMMSEFAPKTHAHVPAFVIHEMFDEDIERLRAARDPEDGPRRLPERSISPVSPVSEPADVPVLEAESASAPSPEPVEPPKPTPRLAWRMENLL